MKNPIGITIATLTMVACGGANKPQMSNQIQHATGPDWVNRRSGAFGGEKGKVFYGVGIASGIRNRAMSRSTSDSRARAEIAKTLNDYVSVLNKSSMASSTAGEENASREEQHVQQALKDYSQTELSGASIVDHWIDNDGTEYALAQLDLEQFKNDFKRWAQAQNDLDRLDKVRDPKAKVRDAAGARLRANGDKAFDELSSEESKHNAAEPPP